MADKRESCLAIVPYGKQEEKELIVTDTLKDSSQKSVVTFGLTGHGKSTFMNFILRLEHFATSQGLFGCLQSKTKETQSKIATVEGQQLLLIDTPGFISVKGINPEQKPEEIFQAHTMEFRRNVLKAYIKASEEVGAFIFIYSLTARWTIEVTQMTKFLESLSFPWDHCIVVLTHGEHAFPGMSEEERYKALDKAMANDELPEQLRKLIINCKGQALIVESKMNHDEEYYYSVLRRFLDKVNKIKCPYRNEHFLGIAELMKSGVKTAYCLVLEDKTSMQRLKADHEMQRLFRCFKDAGKDVRKAQKEFIEFLNKIAELIDDNKISLKEKLAVGFGAAAIAAGIATTVAGIGLTPVTLGTIAVIASGVIIGLGGVAIECAKVPPIVEKLRASSEVQMAEKSLVSAKATVERLYNVYEEIMQKIQKDSLGQKYPEVHSLLFAHLAGVHIHGEEAKGDELCLTAEKLAVYHKLRKQAKEKYKEGSKSNSDLETSPSYALPIGFNLLARGFDVAYTVGAVVEVTQISKESKEVDTRMLKTTCIATLEKEMRTIKLLCKVPKQ